MNIYVLDGLNGIIGIIETFESVIWNVQYFSQNEFQLITAGTDSNLNLLTEGKLLVRDEDITNSEYNNVMLIEKIQLDFDIDKGWILTVSGRGLKSILNRRIIWNQTTISGYAEKCIRQIINDNVINPTNSDRAISNFILGTEQGFTDLTDIQLLGQNIGDWLEEICQVLGFGWDIYISNNKYVFKLYKGTDRSFNQSVVVPVIFSPEYDNLLSSTYSYNKGNYSNAALIGGEGEGLNKRTASIGTATGLNRYESYIDGSSVSSNGEIITVEQYIGLLQQYGQEQLSNQYFIENFEGEIIPNGVYKINQDYFLGDLVQVVNEKGISAVPRIIEIIYSEDSTGTAVIPTFSKWEVS